MGRNTFVHLGFNQASPLIGPVDPDPVQMSRRTVSSRTLDLVESHSLSSDLKNDSLWRPPAFQLLLAAGKGDVC